MSIQNLMILGLLLPATVMAKIDLVTLPQRDQVQLTIYNAADLTLVKEQRSLTLKPGINRLEFSWADTLIDPTSIHLQAPQHQQQVNLLEVSYPPGVQGSAIWTIESQIAAAIPVNISFFTSGIRWRSFYMGTLSADERTLQLKNYIRVDNHSGEDYLNAQTRVVVGTVHLLDGIAELARRDPPYGAQLALAYERAEEALQGKSAVAMYGQMPRPAAVADYQKTKQIKKEGLAEYFIYTIEGTESIAHGWGKRLLSLEVDAIPVQSLYRYDEQRYATVQRLLFFKNDKAHHLGETPLPDGQVMIYRQLDQQQHLSYVGQSHSQYIPVGQEAELNLGSARHVKVQPRLMDYSTENYLFDNKGFISGFDRVEHWQLELENNRSLPVVIEIYRHVTHPYWQLENTTDFQGYYEQVDIDTFKYRLTLPPKTHDYKLNYKLTAFEGERQQRH